MYAISHVVLAVLVDVDQNTVVQVVVQHALRAVVLNVLLFVELVHVVIVV